VTREISFLNIYQKTKSFRLKCVLPSQTIKPGYGPVYTCWSKRHVTRTLRDRLVSAAGYTHGKAIMELAKTRSEVLELFQLSPFRKSFWYWRLT